jgi:hypothetical protein
MRDITCLLLATMLFGTTTLEARVGAGRAVSPGQEATKSKPTLKERILEVPPGTMIEVRLLNKQRIRGRLGEITDEGLSPTTVRGEKIATQKVAFAEVKSFKKVEGGAKAGHVALYMLAGLGALLVAIIIYAMVAAAGPS